MVWICVKMLLHLFLILPLLLLTTRCLALELYYYVATHDWRLESCKKMEYWSKKIFLSSSTVALLLLLLPILSELYVGAGEF